MNKNQKFLSIMLLSLITPVVSLPVAYVEAKPTLSSPSVDYISFHSKLLNKDMRLQVYLPRGYQNGQTYPVLYLIHGHNKDESILQEAGFDQSATQLIEQGRIKPLIIVSPQIDNSWGIEAYEGYLIKEIIPMIDVKYHTISTRSGRAIGGISMGGYVALHLGFYYNQLFSKVGGHMPAVTPPEMVSGWLYPTQKLRQERDPLILAQEKKLSDLQVYLDCGKSDQYGFYNGCQELYKILKKRGVSVENHLNEGNHSTSYIRTQVENYLLFYNGIKK